MVKKYWIYDDTKEMACHDGWITESGDFQYHGAFGINTRFKGYFFDSEQDAAMDCLDQIRQQIEIREQMYKKIQNKYIIFNEWLVTTNIIEEIVSHFDKPVAEVKNNSAIIELINSRNNQHDFNKCPNHEFNIPKEKQGFLLSPEEFIEIISSQELNLKKRSNEPISKTKTKERKTKS